MQMVLPYSILYFFRFIYEDDGGDLGAEATTREAQQLRPVGRHY